MSERVQFFTIDPDEILENKEGHNSRSAPCRILTNGNCPDPVLKRCAACVYAIEDQTKFSRSMMRIFETPPAAELKSDSKTTSVRFVWEDGTETELTHNEGAVIVSRKNPPVLIK